MAKRSDTTPEAERVLLDVYRKMAIGQKWLMLAEDFRASRILHAAGLRLRKPNATDADVQKDWLAVNQGFISPGPIETVLVDPPMQNLGVVREVVAVFDRLGIAYALGGSMASSLYGMDRSTKDADLTAEPFPGKEADFAAAFGPEYYLSVAAIQEAIQKRSCFNIIHTITGFKVDVFIRKDRPFEDSALRRRRPVVLPDQPQQPVMLVSPEDILLFKLEWYRIGNESSDQQWADILAVLKIQAGKLETAYLDKWAPDLAVTDLLARARQEAGQ